MWCFDTICTKLFLNETQTFVPPTPVKCAFEMFATYAVVNFYDSIVYARVYRKIDVKVSASITNEARKEN